MFKVISTFVIFLLLSFSLFANDGEIKHHQKNNYWGKKTFDLVVLHNNDAESQLINAGSGLEDFGGVARFKSLVDKLRYMAKRNHQRVLMLSSGDNFLAGPEFNASLSLPEGVPYYDSKAVDLIKYDAMAIGNHEFDFGPDVLARFIYGIHHHKTPFLSANLSFENEPLLQRLAKKGRIKRSTIVSKGREKIGIIGASTPDLPFISSPRNTTIDPDVVGVIQKEIKMLKRKGINKIILISHLQNIKEDSALASELTDIDIMIAGGGDELLANEDDLLVPGDESVYGPYPKIVQDAKGKDVIVVTTPGDLKYVGRLAVRFDKKGRIVHIDKSSGPVRVAGGDNADAVPSDPKVQELVVDPVIAYVSALAENILGTSEVALEARRPQIRIEETNEGNLIADALLWQATELAGDFGVAAPHVGLQNGGGIRNNSLIPAGDITELTTFDMVPFSNFVTIIPDIPATQFKEIMENAVSQVENVSGRFAHISGFTMVYDPVATAQELDLDGNVTQEGNRVISLVLSDGTVIVEDAAVVDGAPSVNIATIDFLARGGDQYPYRGAEFTSLGVTYQQALARYIVNGLGGLISASQYPEGGEGRITTGSLGKDVFDYDVVGAALPKEYALRANYPNPFNPTTTISYDLPKESPVNISVYSITGQKVANIFSGRQNAGVHNLVFDAANLSSGIYFYSISAGEFRQTRKMILAR